jgi:hypothetical protein
MSQPQVTGSAPSKAAKPDKQRRQRRPRPPPSLAFKIQEFCDAHRISRSHYYNLKQLGLAPDETHIGHVTIITTEAAARWRKQRERDARG